MLNENNGSERNLIKKIKIIKLVGLLILVVLLLIQGLRVLFFDLFAVAIVKFL